MNDATVGEANQAATTAEPVRLFINEWSALDLDNQGEVNDDWLEIYNATNLPVSIGGLILGDASTNYAMVPLSFLGPNEFQQFIADDEPERGADHLPFKLSSSNGETLIVSNAVTMTLIDTVSFGPQVADVSQGRLPDAAPPPYRDFVGGQRTPGASNFLPINNVVINEIIAHTDPPLEDAIELHNPTAAPVDISGWWLSDDRDTPQKFRIPSDTTIPPGGFVVFYEKPFLSDGFNPSGDGQSPSFSLNSFLGDEVNLFTADSGGNLTGFRLRESFGPSLNGVSLGRVITTIGERFVAMESRTFGEDDPSSLSQFRSGNGLPNSKPRVGPIVITEIMYHPPDIIMDTNILDNSLDEFIELKNISSSAQPLFDPAFPTNTWELKNAVSFKFPMNIIMDPDSYLVLVNFDPNTNTTQLADFRALYNMDESVPVFGPYGGKLGNGGETIEVKLPDTPQGSGEFFGFTPFVDADQVKYNDKLPWPLEADGNGQSLQKLVHGDFGDEPTNWVAALPSPGMDIVPNSPPTLQPIVSFTTNEFRPIYITNIAADIDFPSQTLDFSLDPGAPAQAEISPEGVFYWHPNEADGPGVYEITVRVTDNGVPILSASQTFTITVEEVNRQPLLNVQPQYTKAGLLLTFPAGRDTDIPANQLTYSLGPGAPAGLSIGSSSGIVSWTPDDAQAPETHFVTIRVTDDGVPPLANEKTVRIKVLERNATLIKADFLQIGSIIQLSWDATVGKVYQIEYVDNLNEPRTWMPLGPARVATIPNMNFLDLPPSRRFYRILQVD